MGDWAERMAIDLVTFVQRGEESTLEFDAGGSDGFAVLELGGEPSRAAKAAFARAVAKALREAAALEREACAKVAEGACATLRDGERLVATSIADAIRARGR